MAQLELRSVMQSANRSTAGTMHGPTRALRALCAACGLLLALVAAPVAAQLTIEITGAGEKRLPIAIVPLAGEGVLPAAISSIVRDDLERSGLFRGVETPTMRPHPTEASNVDYAEWRARLADALVLGSVAARPDGKFEVRFRLFDVV
jgi:TolB protein